MEKGRITGKNNESLPDPKSAITVHSVDRNNYIRLTPDLPWQVESSPAEVEYEESARHREYRIATFGSGVAGRVMVDDGRMDCPCPILE